MKILEIYEFKHKEIKVMVKIDYPKGQISLVENASQFKKWIFADREIEYMDSWIIILEGMQEAIKDAKSKLEAYKEESNEKDVDLILEHIAK